MSSPAIDGAWIKLELERRARSITWLAERCGTNRPHMSKILKGDSNPRASMVVLIADALEVTADSVTGRGSKGARR